MQKLKRFFLRWLLFPAAKVYWFLSPSIRQTAKVAVMKDGKVLLVRQSFGARCWTLPGGGVDGSETLEQAARREVREEAGVVIDNLVRCGELYSPRKNKITVFTATTGDEPRMSDTVDVLAAQWFNLNELPAEASPRLSRCLEIAAVKAPQ